MQALRRPDSFRDSTLFRRFGTEVFDFAFHAAREAAPHALLAYSFTAISSSTRESNIRLMENF